MYFLLTHRAVKTARDTSERFAARTTTVISLTFSGPFSTRRAAERAMIRALNTFTCLAAEVQSYQQLEARSLHPGLTYDERRQIQSFLRHHRPETEPESEASREQEGREEVAGSAAPTDR